jgi:hypothetical protein
VIELVKGLPDGVVGLEAVGEVTADDYTSVAVPATEDALSRHDRISLLHVLGERFTGYVGGGQWADAKVLLLHPFSNAQRAEAVAWVSATSEEEGGRRE